MTAKGYIQSVKMIFLSPHNMGAQQVSTILSMNMLVGFSLELMLKAWLLQEGRPSSEVKGYGHKIEALFREAQAEGLPRVDGLEELITAVGPGHQDFTFRYIEVHDEVSLLVWPCVFEVLDALDVTLDTHLGASISYGLKPGH